MTGIRFALSLLLAGYAVGAGLDSLLSQASNLEHQAMNNAQDLMNHAQDMLNKYSVEDLAKLASNPEYQRELQQLTQQYANDPEELARRTQALNDKYLGGSGSSSGNGGTGSGSGTGSKTDSGHGQPSFADLAKLATNPDYQRELQQLTQQYANDPEELARRTQALNDKYLNGNGSGNMLASVTVMAVAFVVSRWFAF